MCGMCARSTRYGRAWPAYRRLPLRELGAIGLIAGEVWPGAEIHMARLLALAQRLGVRDRLRLAGFRDDVRRCTARRT